MKTLTEFRLLIGVEDDPALPGGFPRDGGRVEGR